MLDLPCFNGLPVSSFQLRSLTPSSWLLAKSQTPQVFFVLVWVFLTAHSRRIKDID